MRIVLTVPSPVASKLGLGSATTIIKGGLSLLVEYSQERLEYLALFLSEPWSTHGTEALVIGVRNRLDSLVKSALH
jgi:hypothetical protein